MKNPFYLILAFVLLNFNSNSFAQEAKHALGLKAGPSYNFLYGFKELNQASQPAYLYSIGFSYQYYINPNLSLITGLGHDFKGENQYVDFTNEGNTKFVKFTYRRRISYLVTPFILRAYFGKKLKFFLNAGAYAGLTLSHTQRTEIDGIDYGSYNYKEHSRPLDLGLVTGAGIEYPINSKFDLSLELRNNLGLSDLHKQENVTKNHFRLNSLSLLAGLSYKFGNTPDTKN